MKSVTIGGFRAGEGDLFAIAGPCVIESEELCLRVAEQLRSVADRTGVPVVFKSSFLKDNRSSEESFQGPGPEEGLRILAKVRDETGLPVLSDVHDLSDVAPAGEVLDVIQIPAYLCQQTRLLLAAARTGVVINVKKGQFMAPEDMAAAVGKIRRGGNDRILLTERGSSFGYRNLVVDMRSIAKMQQLGVPVVMDATHAVRIYGVRSDDPLGGEPEYIEMLAKAGVAAGADGVFLETHPNPADGLCDAMSMLALDRMEGVLLRLKRIHDAVAERVISRDETV
ncbi:MAG: 3-deoxy-8-phosphooctulonate synthase [Gemmatimonadota bacterium]|nr:3-deoxy-8-phosphooctulonate synthase [Gemmatimonadota bacterium]MDP6461518.1 3-deoxy-8-phosphooctulonate synthase [Gemmatimonadota bacterium]MDP6528087.1 3-deoxy-8-phosphooctulonate synthase [Gemmatimonadota bacterium]MDP6802281.1 3-deoxy-8-phosphooctulonate synthase [Gemmatimonadota bacterium]MDP7031985.1 3-deoxy-8-phosphooctulonate synthase [Gemmatimonadota bacterium]